MRGGASLFLILFLHQTTTYLCVFKWLISCSLFCFYIKPQPPLYSTASGCRCSLFCFYIKPQPCLVECFDALSCSLFCFYIKPQLYDGIKGRRLFLILFLHQTTTIDPNEPPIERCSLFCFYIKPQRLWVVLNCIWGCSLFCFYIKPQRSLVGLLLLYGCSLFCFYIKPQPTATLKIISPVVPYSVSTSNHNYWAWWGF